MTILPSLRECTRPRVRSVPRWWETRFCERPAIHERSHPHSSSPSRSASASMRRVGSERAFARSAASGPRLRLQLCPYGLCAWGVYAD